MRKNIVIAEWRVMNRGKNSCSLLEKGSDKRRIITRLLHKLISLFGRDLTDKYGKLPQYPYCLCYYM